jgi:hypothetical protein
VCVSPHCISSGLCDPREGARLCSVCAAGHGRAAGAGSAGRAPAARGAAAGQGGGREREDRTGAPWSRSESDASPRARRAGSSAAGSKAPLAFGLWPADAQR